METKEDIHVLMVAFSSQGHINPMLRLANRLITSKNNLHVTLATTELARHRILASSSTTTTSTHSVVKIRFEFFSDGLPLDYDRKSNLDHFMDSLAAAGPANLSAIIQRNHPVEFNCVITNPFIPWAADVSAAHGIPCAMLWIQPCALYSIYYRFYNNLNPFPTVKNPDLPANLPGLPLLKTEDLPSFVLPSNHFSVFPKLFDGMFKNMGKFKWVLVNSFEELEKDVIRSMSEIHRVMPVGPLVPPELLGEDRADDAVGVVDMWKSDDDCIRWLDQQGACSVIYVSFGSIVVLSEEQMQSVATGLKKSARPFLWVVKRPDYPDGAEKASFGVLEELKGQGLIVPWSPQIKVLMHPSIGCFLSHCGWNSMLETIAAGVPVIAYPQWTDQPTNAKLIADVWRIGMRVIPNSDGVVTTEEVERCIEEVMGGANSEEFKKNAAGLKVAARDAVADGGSSDRNIRLFVDDIIGHSRLSST
ncbi:hypothetical protein RHMOL_Rhmol05G0108600 [Rhododendron molle]|uniref:Uncharacterized protein n=1 Tax=Rhododendron molle TaxID=49168 RepID=A0ACC0NNV7_RHOML|nr:hypothetical protein RHMOL_Rhmol05G0108600 [Rhododendron molle]